MRHIIMVKFKPEYSMEDRYKMYPEIAQLFEQAVNTPGIYGVKLFPNMVDRPNRYHLAVEIEMDAEALQLYDESDYHKEWKDRYGDMLESKTIIDLEDELVF